VIAVICAAILPDLPEKYDELADAIYAKKSPALPFFAAIPRHQAQL
jgi:hypothetical protein